MSETEGLTAKSKPRTSHVEHWKLQLVRMEQPATLLQIRGCSPQWDLLESPVLRAGFSGGNRIKDNIEESLHYGSAHFKNLFLVLGKVEEVLLTCVGCEEKLISSFLLFLVLQSVAICFPPVEIQGWQPRQCHWKHTGSREFASKYLKYSLFSLP